MPGIQRSPVAYNLQHLREYNSCQIWASQSRRPPYVADVEGCARIEGVVASIHESYMDAHGNKVAEDAVFKSPCVVIIFESISRQGEQPSRDAGGDTSTNKICRSKTTRGRGLMQTVPFFTTQQTTLIEVLKTFLEKRENVQVLAHDQ